MISLFSKPVEPAPERLVSFKVWMIKNGIDFSVVTVCPKDDPSGAAEQCKGSSRIVIFGCDETVHQAISATKGLGIDYGIVPGIFGGDLASGLGITKLPEEEMFDLAINGNAVSVDSWNVNGKFLMLSSISFGAPATAAKGHDGECCCDHAAHMKQAWKKSKGSRYGISCDGASADGEYVIVSVNNVPDVGGVAFTDGSSASDGELEVLVLKNAGFLGKLLGTGFGNGSLGSNKDAKVVKAKKVSITCATEEDCLIDGCVVRLSAAEIEAGEKIRIAAKN